MKKWAKMVICVVLMCTVMVVSTSGVFAGSASKVIGGTATERATCTLNAHARGANAGTVPTTNNGLECYTRVITRHGLYIWYDSTGTTYASVSYIGTETNALSGESEHQAGNYYATLEVAV